jgi:phospholipid transport system substrate-binding protein
MHTRRAAVTMIGATAVLIALLGEVHRAWATSGEQATTFVRNVSDSLAAIANSAGSPEEKRPRFQEILEAAVDIDDTARSCLGSFWQTATTDQQRQYTALFRDLLVTRITNHLGKYRGVRVTVGAARASGDTEIVNTTVDRPRIPISQIDWVVSATTGRPKVVDLLSEGVSMRLTHSSDFTSYLSRHNIDALIEAMRKQNEQRR